MTFCSGRGTGRGRQIRTWSLDATALVTSPSGAAGRREGTRDIRRLTQLLRQPLHSAHNAPPFAVRHCSIRNAPDDPTLTDEAFGMIT